MYKSISIKDENFGTNLVKLFKRDGVVVINDVFSTKECNGYMSQILDSFVNLGTGIDLNNIEETWTTYNTPPQTRAGLFQCMMANIQPVWDIRMHPNVKTIFETLYSSLRGEMIDEFIVSGDGINIKPGSIGPYPTTRSKDWAHIDQTKSDNIYECCQGQAVLTNTSASFVCSPKSHKSFHQILETIEHDKNSNWLKFKDEDIEQVKQIVINNGGKWQIPIVSKRGSFIIWASSLVHSARLQNGPEYPKTNDRYFGWRGVIYVCYRPKNEFTKGQLKKRALSFEHNRVTNHWGTKMFGKKPGSRFLYNDPRHPIIEKMIANPAAVYKKIGQPEIDETLIGN